MWFYITYIYSTIMHNAHIVIHAIINEFTVPPLSIANIRAQTPVISAVKLNTGNSSSGKPFTQKLIMACKAIGAAKSTPILMGFVKKNTIIPTTINSSHVSITNIFDSFSLNLFVLITLIFLFYIVFIIIYYIFYHKCQEEIYNWLACRSSCILTTE